MCCEMDFGGYRHSLRDSKGIVSIRHLLILMNTRLVTLYTDMNIKI